MFARGRSLGPSICLRQQDLRLPFGKGRFLLKRRGRVEIYADVLHVVRSLPNSPMTRISYGANLPLDRAKNILKVLAQCDLIRLEVSDSSRLYRITSRGVEFLETYKRMKGFLSILGEDSPEKKDTNDM